MATFAVHPALASRVAGIEVVTSRGQQLVLPSTSAVLGVQLRGRVRAGAALLSTAGVTGIQDSAREYVYVGATDSILVRFTAQGAACLGVPVSELTQRSLALDKLLPPVIVRRAQEKLHDRDDVAARVAVVQSLLLQLPFVEDRLVTRALGALDGRQLATLDGAPLADAGVAAVARALGLGERQLERRFLARVGVTPKAWATLRRFERAVTLARALPTTPLTNVALDAGYYDQSHFIRDVRRRAGQPPSRLFRRA